MSDKLSNAVFALLASVIFAFKSLDSEKLPLRCVSEFLVGLCPLIWLFAL